MSTKTKAKTEENAKAAFTIDLRKPREIVVSTNQLLDIIKQNPAYSGNTAMQQAVTQVSGITAALAKQESDLQAARANITALVAGRQLNVHAFSRARRGLLYAADQIAGGSAATLQQWGFTAATHNPPLPATDTPPTGLRVRYTKTLAMVIVWTGVKGHLGYLLQIGDGTSTGWGPTIPCTKARYEPTGLTPGQKVAIRVAVQRKNGISTWSDALSVTIR